MFEDDSVTLTGGPLKPHEWVRVKSYISAEDDAWIQNHSAQLGGPKNNRQLVMTIGDVRLALLRRMIITWQLTRTLHGPDGQTSEVQIPCTAQEIGRLPRTIANYIRKKIDELNPDEEEDEQDFLHDAGEPSEGNSDQKSLPPPSE